MDYDIMGVAEHDLDVVNAAEEAGAPASGRRPLDLDTFQANWTTRNQWENDGNDQTTIEIFQIFGKL